MCRHTDECETRHLYEYENKWLSPLATIVPVFTHYRMCVCTLISRCTVYTHDMSVHWGKIPTYIVTSVLVVIKCGI